MRMRREGARGVGGAGRTGRHPARTSPAGARAMLRAVERKRVRGAEAAFFDRTMTQDQESRTTMFANVVAYLDKNKALWTPIKAMVETVGEVADGLTLIARKAGKQQAPNGGAGEEKTNVREDLEETVLEIADQVAALASKTGDAQLAARVTLTRSGVGKLSADELEATAKRVSEAAAENLAALADYGIAEADVTALDALTKKFGGVKTGPRTAISTRAAQTATLPETLNNVTTILRDRLDKQMTPFRRKNPEFYAGYQSARVIVNRGSAASPTPPPPAAPARQPSAPVPEPALAGAGR